MFYYLYKSSVGGSVFSQFFFSLARLLNWAVGYAPDEVNSLAKRPLDYRYESASDLICKEIW